MKITTVILSIANGEHLIECRRSLEESELRNYSNNIVVIDNSTENLGFSGGNNKGIREGLARGAGSDAILLINDDTKVSPNAIAELARSLETDPSTGICVPKIYFYPGYEYHKDRYTNNDRGHVLWYAGGTIDWNNVLGVHRGVDQVDHGQFDTQSPVEFATGCCALIRKETFNRVGFFDERYFLYLEDLDFSVRTVRTGFHIQYVPSATIWHKNAQSSGVGSTLQDYYFTRNRLLFGMTYAPIKTKFALMRESIKLLVKGSALKRRGVMDYYLGNFGKMVE